MPSIRQILEWASSGSHRLVAAAVLFGAMYALKLIPGVEARCLTTPRRRLAAVAFLSMAPAVALLAAGAPLLDVIESAIVIGLGAVGMHSAFKVGGGGTVGAPPP